MQYSGLKNILKKHKLRVTDCRMDVLELFLKNDHALTSKDLENELTGYDRVTLYRTLNSFMEKGVLHKIPNDNGYASYGVCHNTCGPDHHQHNHVHFKCSDCGTIECISDQDVPKIQLDGYIINEINYLVNGVCKSCQ